MLEIPLTTVIMILVQDSFSNSDYKKERQEYQVQMVTM